MTGIKERLSRALGLSNAARLLASDAAVYGLGSAATQIVGLIMLPVYAVYLSPSEYGVLAMTTVLNSWVGAVASLGLSSAVFRFLNTSSDYVMQRRLVSTCFWVVVASCTLCFSALIVFAQPTAWVLFGRSSYAELVRIALISGLIANIGLVAQVVIRADRRVGIRLAIQIIGIVAGTLLTLWQVVVEKNGVRGVLVAGLLSEIILTLMLVVAIGSRLTFAIDAEMLRKALRWSLPMVPHRVQSMLIQMLGQFFVGRFVGLSEAGLYSIATRVTKPLELVVNAFQSAYVPHKYWAHAKLKDAREHFRAVGTVFLTSVVALWVVGSLLGAQVVDLILDPRYHGAVDLIPLVMAIPALTAVYFVCGTGIELGDSTRRVPMVSLVGLTVFLVSAVVLMPRYQAYGAALASAASWVGMSVMALKLSRRYYEIDYAWQRLARNAAISAGVFLPAWLLQDQVPRLASLGAALVATLIVSGFSIRVLKGERSLSTEELETAVTSESADLSVLEAGRA